MTKKPTSEMTIGEILAEIGRDLREIGRYYAANWGLINRNPEYYQLPRDTPLYINCKPYSVKRARKDGEQDLVRLAHEVPYEGSWLYTPKDSTWYHVSEGHREEFSEHGKFSFFSIQIGGSLTILGKRIVHYHTHPKRAGQHMVTYALGELEKKFRETDAPLIKDFLIACSYLYLAFPGIDDIGQYVRWARHFQDEWSISFCGRVALPIGIATAEIKDKSEDTVKLYEKVHGKLDVGKYVQYEEIDGRPTINIALEDMFDNVNIEMQGKLRLTFQQTNCGFPLID
ncbi:MAG: hypothetical protein AB1668_04920 [Nanoarchaeota archaeon]